MDAFFGKNPDDASKIFIQSLEMLYLKCYNIYIITWSDNYDFILRKTRRSHLRP